MCRSLFVFSSSVGAIFCDSDATVLVIFNEYFSAIAHILHIGIVSLPSKQAERVSSDLFFQFFVAVVPLRFGLLDECFVCDLLINLNYFSGERGERLVRLLRFH